MKPFKIDKYAQYVGEYDVISLICKNSHNLQDLKKKTT